MKQDSGAYVKLSNAGAAEAKGIRPDMEDTHVACEFSVGEGEKKQTVQLYGVFDGHGGKEVAEFIRDKMKEILKTECERVVGQDRSLDDKTIPDILVKTNLKLHNQALPLKGGSCATCAVKIGDKIYFPNTGDSRTILCRMGDNIDQKVQQLSEDANPKDEKWTKGVEKRGGRVHGGAHIGPSDQIINDHGIQITQSGLLNLVGTAADIGGRYIGVSHRPKITILNKNDYNQGDYLILACDGLWDVCSNNEAHVALGVLTAQGKSLDETAEGLVAGALKSGSTDNVTAMVIKL